MKNLLRLIDLLEVILAQTPVDIMLDKLSMLFERMLDRFH